MKILLVGAGTMGQVHAAAYRNMPEHNLAGVVDMDPDRAAALSGGVVPTYATLDEGLAGCDAEVVDICLPTYLHKDATLAAATAHRHIICEKPIARSLDEAEAMISAAASAGVQLFVAHVVRFFPEYERVKQMLDSGSFGPVGVVRLFRGGGFPRGWNDWYRDPALSGAVPVDLMVHDLDFLQWCFGPVARVYAKSALDGHHVFASLRMAHGEIAQVEGSWAYPAGFWTRMEVAGRDGLVEYASDEHGALSTRRGDQPAVGGVAVPASPLQESPYFRELRHFLDCLETGAAPRVSAKDAIEALRIALAVQESLNTGTVVPITGQAGRDGSCA